MEGKRRYVCRACSTPGCRVDRCGKADKRFLVDRIAWIRKVQTAMRRLGAKPASFLALDHQWRRAHGYCTNCPRRSKNWFCRYCSARRILLPSRATEYRRVRERPP